MPEYLQTKMVNSAVWLILIFVITALTATYIAHNASLTAPPRQSMTEPSRFEPRHEIKGFRFDSVKNGRPIVSVTADRFSIEKKKIGFIRFALMKEARLENGLIKLYPSESPLKDRTLNPTRQDESQWEFDFSTVLSNVSLSSIPVKKISGFACEPVTVEFYDNQSLRTRIQADSATIAGKKHQILFKGHVHVTSGSNTLKAGKIMFHPENMMFKVDGAFRLQTQNKQLKGRRLKTDVFLTPLNYKVSPTSPSEMIPASRSMKGSDL